ncbi:tetratricopeptide repeat (TPR)-like superfamily protein isoform X2 [Wolffia australiana]
MATESSWRRVTWPSLHRSRPIHGENPSKITFIASKRPSSSPSSRRKLPKNLRHPRRAKLPPDLAISRAPAEKIETEEESEELDPAVWSPEEIRAISSLFERRIPQKPLKTPPQQPPPRRPRLPQAPSPKHHVRAAARQNLTARSPLISRVCKNPETLIQIAREIADLPPEQDASVVLENWGRFLRKGSLSMTIKELGHLGMAERALQTLCWAQTQRSLFPDDKILASAVEVLARNKKLKLGAPMETYLSTTSRTVMEAMARGFIRAGNVDLTRKIILFVRDNQRVLDAGVHAKLILEVGRNPDRLRLAEVLLDELAERDDLDLRPQDCTSIMKICIKLGMFEAVESLFDWFKRTKGNPGVVMYTTVVFGRWRSGEVRAAMAAVWEMEERDMLLDLPAYRVVIRLCVALGDLARAARYFSRLKEAGFAPTYDIYRDMIRAYAAAGRAAKCRQICRELEAAGLTLDGTAKKLLLQVDDNLKV